MVAIYISVVLYCLLFTNIHQARTQASKDEFVKVINMTLVDSVADTVDMDIPNKVNHYYFDIIVYVPMLQ